MSKLAKTTVVCAAILAAGILALQMGFLKSLFGSAKPAWAGFMSSSTYSAFIKDLKAELAKRRLDYALEEEAGTWSISGAESGFGMMNMAQTYNGIDDAKERREQVREFVGGLLTIRDGINAPLAEDWGSAQKELRVRLLPLDMGIDPATLVTVPVCESFLTAIALDKPDKVEIISTRVSESWHKSNEELFKLGLENVWKHEHVQVDRHRADKGFTYTTLVGDNFYVAAHALMLDKYLAAEDTNGALVIIPNRHTIAFVTVDKEHYEVAVSFLAQCANQLFADGPGSITPDVFWWKGGKFSTIRIKNVNSALEALADELTKERRAKL